jgi:hypothetical protein
MEIRLVNVPSERRRMDGWMDGTMRHSNALATAEPPVIPFPRGCFKYLSVNNYIQKRILLVVCGDDEKHAVKEE